MQSTEMLNQSTLYVEQFYKNNYKPYLRYHTITHTRLVALYVTELCNHYMLDSDTEAIIRTAAYFHDTGHLIGPMEGHEVNSVNIMRTFLEGKNVAAPLINKVAACILATTMCVQPITLSESILCDADTYHLGTTAFFEMNELVWEELELRMNKVVPDKVEKSLSFLLSHSFYTSYGKTQLDPGKAQNIEILQSLLAAGKKNGY